VCDVASGTLLSTLCTARPRRRAGQRSGSSVWRCVRESRRFPFFWFLQVTVTNSTRSRSRGSWCWIILRALSRNTRSRSSIVFVLPGLLVRTISHGRVAKKKPAMSRSTAWSIAQAWMGPVDPNRWRYRRNLGVMAR
jgi:hypothetical protein